MITCYSLSNKTWRNKELNKVKLEVSDKEDELSYLSKLTSETISDYEEETEVLIQMLQKTCEEQVKILHFLQLLINLSTEFKLFQRAEALLYHNKSISSQLKQAIWSCDYQTT